MLVVRDRGRKVGVECKKRAEMLEESGRSLLSAR
jgi:hypothetical protein